MLMRNQVLPGDWMQHRDSGTAMLYYYNSLALAWPRLTTKFTIKSNYCKVHNQTWSLVSPQVSMFIYICASKLYTCICMFI